jgi:HAD superfamily hydrolase (TIGR01509 family)
MKPELIIFDNDGVLIDSEIIGHRINALEMTRLGFPMTIEKSIELLTGITKDRFDKIMLQEYGKTMSDADVMNMIKKIEDSFPTDLKPIVEITQVLDFLEQNHIKKCIATSGAKDYVTTTLSITNLDNYFKPDQIFSSTMVNYKGKPAPDVFLLAAQHFRVNPKDCLVIEDSILGIEAAKAANMPVIGFLAGAHACSPWYRECILTAGPTIIIENAGELLHSLKKWCQTPMALP